MVFRFKRLGLVVAASVGGVGAYLGGASLLAACISESVPTAGGERGPNAPYKVASIATYDGELDSFGVSKTHICFATRPTAPGKRIACVPRGGGTPVTVAFGNPETSADAGGTEPDGGAADGGALATDAGAAAVPTETWGEVSAVADDFVYFRPLTENGVSTVLRAPVARKGAVETVPVTLPAGHRFGGALRYEPATRSLVAFVNGPSHDRALVRFPADGPSADGGAPYVEIARALGVFGDVAPDLVPVGNGYVFTSGLGKIEVHHAGPDPDGGAVVDTTLASLDDYPSSLRLLRGQGENAAGADDVYYALIGAGFTVSPSAKDAGPVPFGIRLASTPLCADTNYVYIAGRTGEYGGSPADVVGVYRVARKDFSTIGAVAELHAELVLAESRGLRVACDGQDFIAFAPIVSNTGTARFAIYVFPH